MKPAITLNYNEINAAIRANQGRAALMINPDGDTSLVDNQAQTPANHATINLPLPIGNHADMQAIELINGMNGNGWGNQRIYGQKITEMFTFEYQFR